MKSQTHRIRFGKNEKAVMSVNNPILRFWKEANVEWDLSKCSKEHQSKVLSFFADILKKKIEKREIVVPIGLYIKP